MKWILGIALAVVSLMPHLAPAEPPPPSFARGFEKFNALGPPLPDRTSSWRKPPRPGRHNSNALNELSTKMTGGAWIVSAPDEDPPMAIPFGFVVPTEIELPESTTDGDIESDVNLIIDAVNGLERVNTIDDFVRPWGDSGSRTFGPLMIFATQLHQAGHPELADKIAWTLFQAAPNREVVIDAAINHLGDELHNQIADRFFESFDWQAYRDELIELTTRLPRGWDARLAAAMVVDSLALRLDHPAPPIPELDDIEIPPASLDAITWMAEPPDTTDSTPDLPAEVAAILSEIPAEYHAEYLESAGFTGAAGNRLTNPGLWLLPPTDDSNPPTGPAAPLQALGTGAIPVLAALADDAYPTHFENPARSRHDFSYSRSPIERAMQTHTAMNRPATRGDIARMLLIAILPDARSELRRADPHTLRETALDFHRAHHGEDWGVLAATYLGEGDDNQKTHAARLLATSPNPRHHEIFETHVLESHPPSSTLSFVIIYAQQRKTEAKPLIEKYLPLIREEIGDDDDDIENNRNLPWDMRRPGQLKQTLRQLESIAEGKSPEDSAREIAAGSAKEAETAIPALLQSIPPESPETGIQVLLTGAHAAEDPEIRTIFLGSFFRIRNIMPQEGHQDDSQPEFPESQREAWTNLIEDTRAVEPGWSRNIHFPTATIGELAALAAEYSLMSRELYDLHQSAVILDQSIAELCLARVKARLNNQNLPTLPDPENVTDDRLREIVASAGAKPASDIIAYLDTLTPDERAAWFQWFHEPEDLPRPDSVRQLAYTIIKQDNTSQSGIDPIPGLLNLETGFIIHEDTIDGYIRDLAENAADHSLTTASIRSTGFPPGLTSWTTRATIPEKSDDDEPDDASRSMHSPIEMFRHYLYFFARDETPENADALIICQFYTDEIRESFNWWVVGGELERFAVNNRGEIETQPDSTLAETIATARATGAPPMLSIQIITRADAEKLTDN